MYILGVGSCLSDNFYMHVQVQKHLNIGLFHRRNRKSQHVSMSRGYGS